MKRIAMMNCLKANDVCTGSGCMRAFYERTGAFERYGDEELRLTAFARCSRCVADADPLQDEDFVKKADRLVEIGTEIVHIGVCAFPKGVRCPGMEKMAAAFEERGMEVVWRTH